MRSRPGGRPHDVAVVEGQHHGPARLGVEDPREPVLHAPVRGARSLQEEAGRLHGHADREILFFLDVTALGFSCDQAWDLDSFGKAPEDARDRRGAGISGADALFVDVPRPAEPGLELLGRDGALQRRPRRPAAGPRATSLPASAALRRASTAGTRASSMVLSPTWALVCRRTPARPASNMAAKPAASSASVPAAASAMLMNRVPSSGPGGPAVDAHDGPADAVQQALQLVRTVLGNRLLQACPSPGPSWCRGRRRRPNESSCESVSWLRLIWSTAPRSIETISS